MEGGVRAVVHDVQVPAQIVRDVTLALGAARTRKLECVERPPYDATYIEFGLAYRIDLILYFKQSVCGCERKQGAYSIEDNGAEGDKVECGSSGSVGPASVGSSYAKVENRE